MKSSKNRSYRARAVVLGHIEYGEADRILRLFTYEKGKISAIARGVRKIKSRKAGHLEPFTHVNLFLSRGRNLDIITQAETVEPYMGLRTDLQRIAQASYVVEVLDRFTYEDGQNVGVFRLLTDTLDRLANQANLQTVIHFYEMRLLDLLGFRPQLFECIDCGAKVTAQDQYFSPLGGGIVCPKCRSGRPEAWEVKTDTLRYLRHLQRSQWQTVKELEIPEAIESGVSELIEHYLSYLLERKLNTPEFIRQLQNNQTPPEVNELK